MYGHDPKDDPYQYDHDGRTIQNVHIQLNKIPEYTLQKVTECIINKTPFILHNGESAVGFYPADYSYFALGEKNTFPNEKQFKNMLKLTLIAHHSIVIPQQSISEPETNLLLNV